VTARLRLPDLGWPALVTVGAAALGLIAGGRPVYAVAAAIALLLVAVVVLGELAAGLCAFVLISFVDVLPGGPALSFTKLIGLLLALCWLATIATRDDVRKDFFSEHPALLYLLAVFLAWSAFSTLWAIDQGQAATAASRYGLNFLLFPIVYTALRERRHALWLAWTFVVAALASGAYGLVHAQPSDEGRLTGAVGEANELASVLVAAFAIAVALAITRRRSPEARLVAVGAALACAAGVLLSLSRSGLLALGVVMVAGVFVAGRWRGKATVLAVVGALCALAWFGAFASTQTRDRFTRLEGGTGRVDLWRIGWRMTEDRPLTGVGAGNFVTAAPRYLVRPGLFARDDFVLEHPKQTHNIYLQALAELGIPGLLLFGAVIGLSLSCSAGAARCFRRSGDATMEALAWGFLIAAIGVLAADFFQSEQFSKQLWLLLALGPALLGLARRGQQA
jgi:O-antigen ligase